MKHPTNRALVRLSELVSLTEANRNQWGLYVRGLKLSLKKTKATVFAPV